MSLLKKIHRIAIDGSYCKIKGKTFSIIWPDEQIRIPLLSQQNDTQGGEGEGDDGPGEAAGFHAGKGMG